MWAGGGYLLVLGDNNGLYYFGEQIVFEIAELDALDILDDWDTVNNENNVANDW
jgi:hypothetical protein